jgi:hypothetical protein
MARGLDGDIRALAETMQQRRREAKKRVANQEIMGMRFMPTEDVGAAAERNWERITGRLSTGPLEPPSGSLTDLADAIAYGLELLRRQAQEVRGVPIVGRFGTGG